MIRYRSHQYPKRIGPSHRGSQTFGLDALCVLKTGITFPVKTIQRLSSHPCMALYPIVKSSFQTIPCPHSKTSITPRAHPALCGLALSFQEVSICKPAVRTYSSLQMQQPEQLQPSSFSLWLEPEPADPLYGQLVREMDHLATSFHGPRFVPHVTLLGGMDMSEDQARDAAAQIASKIKPYTLHFEKVQWGSFFFQCVFIRIKQDPETMEAAAIARHECGMDPAGPYMPHLSLLYADLDDKTKEEVAAASQSRLFNGQEDTQVPAQSYPVKSLTLWHTPPGSKPTLSNWKKVASFPVV
ncbi:cyclic phosphodiesterase-like protein-domain-containing protein [Dunaliella salina]|uniref:Cyclic phosphodiesterase-like protein-domain-containing protein n=1 Tax=Dunaliella salina TaxID=3046 RepID=A0ABQ7GG72_DUNSA|nr:cyclic phosphodiesterase-like protein-domain-containing protein [Dunaliella salina]|eukprot:KAF5833605.1 cyclic phosphodiesterase-like protein-domain-containing protein [Dunaliella salina]